MQPLLLARMPNWQGSEILAGRAARPRRSRKSGQLSIDNNEVAVPMLLASSGNEKEVERWTDRIRRSWHCRSRKTEKVLPYSRLAVILSHCHAIADERQAERDVRAELHSIRHLQENKKTRGQLLAPIDFGPRQLLRVGCFSVAVEI